MWSFSRLFRRPRGLLDNWKLSLILMVSGLLVIWNFSAFPEKSSVEIQVKPRNDIPNVLAVDRDLKSSDADTVKGSEIHINPPVDEKPNAPIESNAVPKEEPKTEPQRQVEVKQEKPVNTKKEPEPELKTVTTGVPCPVQQTCKSNEFSYHVQSGLGLKDPPIICYNNELIVGKGLKDPNHGRGANIVVIHPKFKTVMDVKSFDLYDSVDNCRDMAVYLSTYVQFKSQVLLASYDDMTFRSLQTLLNQYGSSKIKDVKFRDGYVFVGEKGLPGNFAIEKIAGSDGKNFPKSVATISGCATHPISTKYVDVSVEIGYELENCGVSKCGYDEIEIHVSTATGSLRKPKLCISNKYVFYPGLKGGRGFNLVELDPKSKTIINVAEYDTYEVESSRLELFLENVKESSLLIVIVCDDGSTSLKPHARELLKTFGFNADIISMRTTLYFVGRKGLKATPYQVVHQPDNPKSWPIPINERFCLPTEVVEATLQQITNKARSEFCAQHDSFADFCYVHHKTEPLIAAEKISKYDAISEVFEVPILVLGGVNNIALSHTLRALLQQPGLNKPKVYVAYSTMFGEDYRPFIKLFEFNVIEIQPVSRYVDFLTAAFNEFWKLNSEADFAIVIDDEIVPKTGFLWYMGHALLTMIKDTEIGAASAWNPQGFEGIASNSSAVHIVSTFPGQSFLISKDFYDNEIKGREQTCCNQRSIQQWFTAGTSKPYRYIVPEVSRADYFSSTAYSAQAQPLSNLAMSRPRTPPSSNFTDVPLDMDYVINYKTVISEHLRNAYYTTEHDLIVCKNNPPAGNAKAIAPFVPQGKRVAVVVYSQKAANDYTSLRKLYHCFGLMYMDGYPPFGMYDGVTFVTVEGKRFYLVGTSSAFYKNTVQSLTPLPYVAQF